MIFGASLVGAPVSTTQVVASSVVGVGVGRRRWRHVHWAVVRHMGLAWLDHDAGHRRARRRRARALAAGHMSLRRWFLPETPDVLGLLRRQVAVTIEGVDAFAAWAAGDATAAEAVRDAEHRGDAAKRELLTRCGPLS